MDPRHLSGAQRDVYERITTSPRAGANRARPLTDDNGRLLGPFNAILFSPEVGGALQELGTAIRYRGTLPPRLREIAILEVARGRRCGTEWHAHAHAGRLVGISDEELAAIASGTDAPTFDHGERLARHIVAQLITDRDLDDRTVEDAGHQLGLATVNELVMLVGYYDLLALSLRVWRTPECPFPDPDMDTADTPGTGGGAPS